MEHARSSMGRSGTFFAFAYLLNGAHSLNRSAKHLGPGCNYSRVSAAIFAAFAVEGCLNHIGEQRITGWKTIEESLQWKRKLRFAHENLGREPDFSRPPLQRVVELFEFRNKLAHGKNEELPIPDERDAYSVDPEWLAKYWNEEELDKAINDARSFIEQLLEWAGFNRMDALLISSGAGFLEKRGAGRG